MDFDTAKENIQPLRQGRRADRLETALSDQNKETLETEKKQHEEAITKYEGLDPLSAWYEYICWIEQSYPSGGTESGLDEVVLKCIMHFESDSRYKQDRRMIKLYIKYIDSQDNPQELYNQLYSNGIGSLVADLYIAWSYYYDAMNNYKQVEAIFRKGFDAGAQPLDDLSQAHQAFGISMSRRMLYDDASSKQQFAAKMEEKRSALTSLRAHRKKFVGSARSGIAVRDVNPGVVNQENVASSSNVAKLEIHEDVQGAVALPANTSVIRSIIESARKKENVHEPGPWSKAKDGKSGKLFGKAGTSSQLDFNIMEDDGFPQIPCHDKLFEKGIQLPNQFVLCNKPQKPWDIPVFIEEPPVARSIPCYDKFLCYPNKTTDISPEELRGYKWFVKRGITTTLTKQYEKIWSSSFEIGARIPPGFVSGNVKQVEKEEFEKFINDEDVSGYQTSLKKVYPAVGDELSFEELLAQRFQRGQIKLLTEEDFEEVDNMDITDIGDRRQSVYAPSRLSFMPRKSIVMSRKSILTPPVIEEEEDDEEPQFEMPAPVPQFTGAIRKSIVKRKFVEEDCKLSIPEHLQVVKKDCTAETPPRSVFNVFKPPPPVEKKQVVFNVDDDDETCSTQQFNLFIKQQSVSTPVSKKRPPMPALIENQVQVDCSPEPEVQCEQTAAENMAENKKLSTIMETTEMMQSIKSSSSSGNDTDLHPKTPKHVHSMPHHEPEIRANPMLASFRMPEDQTETCTKITIPVRAIHNTTLKTQVLPSVPFEIYTDDSMVIPPPNFELSVRSLSSEGSSKATQQDVTQIEFAEVRPLPENSFAVPPMDADASIMNIPPTQREQSFLDIPATQDLPVPHFSIHEETEIPATEDMDLADHFEIPATQEVEVNEELDIPATEDFEVPATQQPEASKLDDKKNDSIPFSIYEDSMMEEPKTKTVAVPKIPDDEGTGFMHMSRKENLVVPPANPVRSLSDEFLAMCASPPKSNVDTSKKNDLSDLLKFSAASGIGNSLTSGLKGMKINEGSNPSEGSLTEEFKKSFSGSSLGPPKSATPTQNLFDEDLNTEKFSLALGNYKNSTLLVEARMSNDEFNLSVPYEEDELKFMSKSKSKVEKKSAELENFKAPEFKMPLPPAPPAPKTAAAKSFNIFEDFDEEFDDENDMSKSIYLPRAQPELKIEEKYEEAEDLGCSFAVVPSNRYEHTLTDNVNNLSVKVQDAIIAANGNPFDSAVRECMLEHCNFSQYLEDYSPTCTLLKKIPQLKPSLVVDVNDNSFVVMKFIAKGGFGSIYTGRNCNNGKTYALKQEKPPNLWELYICVELKDRLKVKQMLPAFMNVEHAVVAMNASILITQFSPYGSIIDVCNKHKVATNKNVDEYVVMVLTTQLLSIMDHLHACKIIHGDIKPDNFLVMSKIEYGMRVPALQLIDFGDAIDMDWYNKETAFTVAVTTENFICCEMQEGKPWTYQTDLFGLAGTSHVMLFGKYMQVEKKIINWNVTTHYPRYFNKILWDQFFTTLLNVPDCKNMPNLQALKDQFMEVLDEKQKYACEKINEFNKALEG